MPFISSLLFPSSSSHPSSISSSPLLLLLLPPPPPSLLLILLFPSSSSPSSISSSPLPLPSSSYLPLPSSLFSFLPPHSPPSPLHPQEELADYEKRNSRRTTKELVKVILIRCATNLFTILVLAVGSAAIFYAAQFGLNNVCMHAHTHTCITS